ncbi:MAG: phosphate signaling complex protein PhoU [Christensenellaceae bacterium]|jgi:phosphate transport system protein
MRSRFDEQLALLNTSLVEMGTLIEHAIESASDALINQDIAQAKRAIIFDQKVDEKEREIESLCMKLLLQQQPVARDLRLISSALKMITDMERIGDQAADISEIVIMMDGEPYIKELVDLPKMAAATIQMVRKSVDAFVQRDAGLARQVIESDDIVDDLFYTIRKDLIQLINQNVENGEQALDLLMISKYFERIGDHAVNIAEWVEYAVTGVMHKAEWEEEIPYSEEELSL